MPKTAYFVAELQQIKNVLIDAGLKLFSAQGIQHSTVEQIYTRAGILKPFLPLFSSQGGFDWAGVPKRRLTFLSELLNICGINVDQCWDADSKV